MSFSPNLFLANAKLKDGFAKQNRFEVILPIPPYVMRYVETSQLDKMLNNAINTIKDITTNLLGEKEKPSNSGIETRYLAMQCESAKLPGKILQTTDIDIYGPTFKVPYKTQIDDNVELSFICTNEFYERKLFEKWIESINPQNTYNLRYAKEQQTTYLSDISIIQYDEFIKQIFIIKLIDAFPIGISPMPLSWSSGEFHRLSINFTYRKYEIVYKGSYDLAAAAATLFGSIGSRVFDTVQSKIFFK